MVMILDFFLPEPTLVQHLFTNLKGVLQDISGVWWSG